MKIENFAFKNYRNLIDGKVKFSPDINIIYGYNAQGKTNLLEAIWLFTGGRSFRGAKDSELIKFSNKETTKALLEMDFYSKQREQTAQITINKENNIKKTVILNNINKGISTAMIGVFCSVVFSPEHLSLIKEGPSHRRKFMDAAICQIKPAYTKLIVKYNKCLIQRNILLKEINYNDKIKETLDIWDKNISTIGSKIIIQRIEYFKKLKNNALKIYDEITEKKEKMNIEYKINNNIQLKQNNDKIELKMYEALQKNRLNDIKNGNTSVGPHRDDVNILIDGKDAKTFASQGQQRTCILTLKLSEARVLEESNGEKPVILLDDVFSELDIKRQTYLMESIKEWQTFITCCDLSIVDSKIKGKVFEVKKGKITNKRKTN